LPRWIKSVLYSPMMVSAATRVRNFDERQWGNSVSAVKLAQTTRPTTLKTPLQAGQQKAEPIAVVATMLPGSLRRTSDNCGESDQVWLLSCAYTPPDDLATGNRGRAAVKLLGMFAKR
jgi:hypothetical protein